MRINGPIIRVEPLGSEPYEKYRVTFNIRTIISPRPTYREQTVCILSIPPNYPVGAPSLVAEQTPYPWHINWFTSGSWCLGTWNRDESLVNFLTRCGRTLQFDPEIGNPGSPANRAAMEFWDQNKGNRRVMPSDTQVLPTLDENPVIVAPQPQITIRPREEKPKVVFRQQSDKPKIILPTQG
jgi:ubiquitin-protein ligase